MKTPELAFAAALTLTGCLNLNVEKVPEGTEMSTAAAKEVVDIAASFPYPANCTDLKEKFITSALRYTTLDKVNQDDKSADLSDGLTKVKLIVGEVKDGIRNIEVSIANVKTSSGAFHGSLNVICKE